VICIAGGPRTGKTTLAMQLVGDSTVTDWGTPSATFGGPRRSELFVRHTDDLIGKLDWSAASAEVATWLDEDGPWIIEGVAVSRALRKWRDQHPGERPPVDRVIRLTTPHVALSKGQAAMAKGEESVWQEIEDWLHADGVGIIGCPRCGKRWLSCDGHRHDEHAPMTAPQRPRSSMSET
jgi:hypothetical protein